MLDIQTMQPFFLLIFQIPPYFLVGACQVSELVQEHSNMFGNLIYFEDLQVAAKSLAMSQSQVVATRLYETSFLHRNNVDFPFLQKNTEYKIWSFGITFFCKKQICGAKYAHNWTYPLFCNRT